MLDILYRDQYLVAIHKPAGLLVHRSNLDRHETRFAVQLLRDQIGRRVHPVHRLDKPTSGVLLFALDAFGGGFVIQSIIAYWFHIRFQLDPAMIGTIFLFANLLAGVSALAAGWLARRIGLINTMIFTHLPSNVLLILVPLMPDVYWAIGLLLLRFSISQMDVPTRQAYTMAVVRPDERSAAAGVTAVARSVGASISPMLATLLVGSAGWMSMPFFLAGGIKIAYVLLLYRAFATSEAKKNV